MIKNYLLLVFCFLWATANHANNFNINYVDTALYSTPNKVIHFAGTFNNPTDSTIKVTISFASKDISAGWDLCICGPDLVCYPKGLYTVDCYVPPKTTNSMGVNFWLDSTAYNGSCLVRYGHFKGDTDYVEFKLSLYVDTVNTGIDANNANKQFFLNQNYPNPFTHSSVIEYSTDSKPGKLLISDLSGKLINEYLITGGASDNLLINGSDLSQGTYLYTLMINNKAVLTRKMNKIN